MRFQQKSRGHRFLDVDFVDLDAHIMETHINARFYPNNSFLEIEKLYLVMKSRNKGNESKADTILQETALNYYN